MESRDTHGTFLILRAADQTGFAQMLGRPGPAAELLGTKPTTLASRIKKLGLKRGGSSPPK